VVGASCHWRSEGLLVGGLLLALMPSLRQWQLAPTTQNDTADDSPAGQDIAALVHDHPGAKRQLIMAGAVQGAVIDVHYGIGLLVGGLLLALMPSLRQWQLAPTTQNDTADDSITFQA
jgi:hypothetical protein